MASLPLERRNRRTMLMAFMAALAMLGLQDTSPALLEHLRGLESEAVHAVLVAVLAERSLDDETRRRRELGLA